MQYGTKCWVVKKQHILNINVAWNDNVKMDKLKYKNKYNSKCRNSHNYKDNPNWWKQKECELFEMVLSYSKESDKCTKEDVDTLFCIYQYLKSLVPMMIISHLY